MRQLSCEKNLPRITIMMIAAATLRTLMILATLAMIISTEATASSTASTSSSRIRRRQLPAATGDKNSIGGTAGGANRPTTAQTQQPSPAPMAVEEESNNNNGVEVGESGPPRRTILPFTIGLWPVNSLPNYQTQIGVRNTVESMLELKLMVKYSPSATSTAVSRSAVVNDVGLTEILNVTHTPGTSYLEMTFEGMVYFAQGSTEVPSSAELAVWMVSEALPGQALFDALTAYFPALEELETYLPGEDSSVDISSPVASSTTDAPTLAPSTEDPTESPTIAVTTLSPTQATPSPTVATGLPTATPTEGTEEPTVTPTQPPVPAIVVVAPTEKPVQQPSASFEPAPPVQQPTSALFEPAPPPQLGTASATANINNNNNTTINVNVLIGCAVAGFVALVLAAVMLVKVTKSRRNQSYKNNKSSANGSDDKISLAILNFGMKKSDGEYDNEESSSESGASSNHRLVEMDIARIMNLEDEEVLSGYLQKGDSQESASWASENRQGKKKNGNAVASMPRSPSQVSGSRAARENESDIAVTKASNANTTSMWASLFGKSKRVHDDQESTSTPPGVTQELGSASVGSTDGGIGTDGTLSDSENMVGTIKATKTVESFENRARHDYVVKKDMLESSATAMALASLASAAVTNQNKSKHPQEGSGSSSNHADLVLSKSEVEEDLRKSQVMIPNPYFRRSFNGTQPIIDKSSSCALKPTDVSAASLAERDNSEDNDDIPHRSSFSRMVPRISSPKSWWRNSTPCKDEDQKTAPNSKRNAAGPESEDDTTFGPSPSDGWDPADCEIGSKGASLPTDELFKLKVDNKTGQCLIDDYSREDHMELDELVRISSMKKTDYHHDASGSVSSEESASLKLDSSFSLC